MSTTRNLVLSVLLVAGMLAGVGCKTTPKIGPWTVKITKKTPSSIEVDLIGVTPLEKQRWENTDLDQYWKSAGSQVRRDAGPLSKILERDQPWVVSITDAKWNQWLKSRGATELLIIANLPGKHPAGPADPRRVFLPLDRNFWESKDTLEVEIRDTSILPITPQKPQK